jgi:hypothetical protein
MCTEKVVRATLFSGSRNADEQKQKTKSKEKGNEQVSANNSKEGRDRQERKEREMLYCNSSQPAPLSCAFSLYVLSTDLGAVRAVSMTCSLCAEQRKRDSSKNESEGKNNGHEQRREPLVTRTVL